MADNVLSLADEFNLFSIEEHWTDNKIVIWHYDLKKLQTFEDALWTQFANVVFQTSMGRYATSLEDLETENYTWRLTVEFNQRSKQWFTESLQSRTAILCTAMDIQSRQGEIQLRIMGKLARIDIALEDLDKAMEETNGIRPHELRVPSSQFELDSFRLICAIYGIDCSMMPHVCPL